MDPLVSVIIPTHNRAGLLPRAILSVLNQTYTNLECIVVDDASTDDTAQVVRQFTKDQRFTYICHETNRHSSAARNTGIAHAKGDFNAFLDDDDEWLPTKLEKQVSLIQRLPNKVGLLYCWMDYCDEAGRTIAPVHPTHRGYIFDKVLDRQRIGGCPTLLVRKSVTDSIRFDECMRICIDTDFIKQVCKVYEVDYVPEVLVKVYIQHGLPRLTMKTKLPIEDIKANLIILKKFGEDFDKHKKQKASIYSVLANNYGKANYMDKCFYYFYKAFITYPFAGEIYREVRNLIKNKMISTVSNLLSTRHKQGMRPDKLKK